MKYRHLKPSVTEKILFPNQMALKNSQSAAPGSQGRTRFVALQAAALASRNKLLQPDIQNLL